MNAEDLHAAVLAVPGVSHAEVALRDERTPVVRVWTDGSRDDGEVKNDVADIVAIHGYGSDAMGMSTATLEARVADTLHTLPTGGVDRGSPPSLQAPPPAPGLVKLAIEETGDSVVAVASDATGRAARARVGDGPDAFHGAIADAVALLRGVSPTPTLVSVEDRFVAGVDVVSVLIEDADGERHAGAAVVRGGRPFSVGRAVDAALSNAD